MSVIVRFLYLVFAFLRAFGIKALLPIAAWLALGMASEYLAKRNSTSWKFNCWYTVFFAFFDVTFVSVFSYFVTAWVNGLPIRRLVDLSTRYDLVGVRAIPLAICLLVLYDFFYYWLHRAQHSWGWLWAQHSLHHSDESMNVTTTWRHHWLEMPLHILFVTTPAGLIFAAPAAAVSITTAVGRGLGYFVHLNAPIDCGRILASPHTHRIHHSRMPEHLDKNFAVVLPLWDVIFGTYYAPKAHESPETGLYGGSRIVGFWNALVWPFKKWDEMLRARHSRG